MKVRAGVEVASLSDVGCQRENNEDSLAYWESPDNSVFARLGRLAVVADGMGGCEGGQFASRIAVESVEQVYTSSADPEPQQRLLQGFREAHARIQQRARENPALLGMGTTMTAFSLVGNNLYYAHVGDSRLYLQRAGKLHLVTHDHSLVSRLVETGIIRAEDADNHPQKHVLTAAVGIAEENQPDSSDAPVLLEKADVLLLCTDGLWGQVSDPELEQILASQGPAEACRSLVQLAKDRGGPDNITLQVARLV
jgi:serine/threonine protein phosphatase PrpC